MSINFIDIYFDQLWSSSVQHCQNNSEIIANYNLSAVITNNQVYICTVYSLHSCSFKLSLLQPIRNWKASHSTVLTPHRWNWRQLIVAHLVRFNFSLLNNFFPPTLRGLTTLLPPPGAPTLVKHGVVAFVLILDWREPSTGLSFNLSFVHPSLK